MKIFKLFFILFAITMCFTGCVQKKASVPENVSCDSGMAYYSNGKYEQALSAIDKCLDQDRQNVEALYLKGLTLWKLNRSKESIEQFSRAIKIMPDMGKAYSMRGAVYLYLDEFDKAMADFDAAIQYSPDFTYTYANRAVLLVITGKFDAGIKACDIALKLEPENNNIYLTRAIAYYLKSIPIQAVNDCLKSIEITNRWANPYFILGGIYDSIHQYTKAQAAFEAAVKINPYIFSQMESINRSPVDVQVKKMHNKFSKKGRHYLSQKKKSDSKKKSLIELLNKMKDEGTKNKMKDKGTQESQ